MGRAARLVSRSPFAAPGHHGGVLAVLTHSNLPADPDAVRALALEQNRVARALWEQLEILKHQIAQLNRAQFGASSERLPGQAELFTQPLDLPSPPAAPEVKMAGHPRKGRAALPKDLPRTRIEYDLADARSPNWRRCHHWRDSARPLSCGARPAGHPGALVPAYPLIGSLGQEPASGITGTRL